jgi:hypothetical protein
MENTYKIKCELELKERLLADIICTAVEGGIGYWATIDNTTIAFGECYKRDLCTSEAVWDIIKNGGEVVLFDNEEDQPEVGKTWTLTLEKFLKGVSTNMTCRPFDCDPEDCDAVMADCIIQYALFDEIIYG